ncbi:MAG: hypothetical protein GW911_35430, partial [Armatimonadetes bacterium]|nr:hypothetical protein [Armatimonadota bacterium]
PINTTVADLSVDTSAGAAFGNQWITESNGLTDLNLNAGAGDVTLTLTLGGITDTAADGTDIAATNATVTLNDATAQNVGAAGAAGNVETSVDTLTVDTSAGGGNQFLSEASGLTELLLNAGTGNVTLTTTGAGNVLSADAAVDILGNQVSATLNNGDFGDTDTAAGNAIETTATQLTVDTSNSGNNQFIRETDGLTYLNLTANDGGGDVHLYAGAAVTQGAGVVTASGLQLLGPGGFTLTTNTNDVVTLAAEVTGAGNAFTYVDADALSIGSVGGTDGVRTNNGAINISTVAGNLTVTNTAAANDVWSNSSDAGTGGTMTLTAGGLDSLF